MLRRLAPFGQRCLALARHPLVRNSVQVSMIYAAGDITQQLLFTKRRDLDKTSIKNVMIVGGCVLAPLYTFYYNYLNQLFPGSAVKTLIQKICFDQLVGGSCGTIIFFVMLSILEGEKNIFRECREKFLKAYLCNTLYYPWVMIFIFKKVPTSHQPVAVACADFLWSIFLCWYKMQGSGTKEQIKAPLSPTEPEMLPVAPS